MSWRWVPLPISLRLSSRSSAKMSLRSSSMAGSSGARASARGGGEHGVDDGFVSGAAADGARDCVDDLFAGGRGVVVEQGFCRHQHARRAIAALRGEMFHEGALQRVKIRPILEAVERLHRAAFNGLGQRQAGKVRIAVDQHRAGATSTLAASGFGGHVADQFSQGGHQIDGAVDEDGDGAAVMTKLQGGLGHRCFLALPYCWPLSRRRRWTPTTSRRYQALASESSVGDVPSVTAATAASIFAASSARPSRARSAPLARTAVAAIAPSAMRTPMARPPLDGTCAASVTTEPPFGLMRAILR